MPFYLSEFAGTGSHADPFVAVGADQPGATMIDLRPDPSRLDGGGLNACILRVPSAFTDARARLLADDKLERLTNPQKNFLQNRLGVDLSSPTLLRDIIATLLNRPPANGWKPIKPGRLKWEIWLGGELIWEAPHISGGATDDFNRANGNVEVGQAAWTKRTGGARNGQAIVASNALDASGGADCFYHFAGAATTDNQYAQLDVTNIEGAPGGPAVRVNTTSLTSATGYSYDTFGTDGVFKCISDTFTLLAASATAGPVPGTIRVDANGSTIGLYIDGTANAPNYPLTDTSVTTGQPGFFCYGSGMDNWAGGDLAAASQTLAPSADSVDGNWHDNTGGTSLAAAIDETSASDTDYIRSELGPSASACRVKLAAGGDPASSTGHIVHWRAGKDSTGGATIGMTVKLYQGGGNSIGGGTLIASFTRSNVAALTTYDETLSGGEADSITNYADLYLEFSANQT